MDVSVWKSNQSMETKRVCILLMNEDLTCNKFVTDTLQHYSYQVLHTGDASGVLNAIHKMKDRLELVLANAYMSETDGGSVVKYIQNKINLPISLLGPDTLNMVPKGQARSYTAYVINGLRREEITKLRELTLQNAKGKMATNNQEGNIQRATATVDAIGKRDSSTVSETTQTKKRKGHAENDGSREDESPVQKKGRVHWSTEMHKKFLEAIETIGYDRAVPKKIVEVMNVPGLTRENVASHLQKHRENIRREIALISLPANTANQFKSSPFLRPNSTTCLSASRNSYFMQARYNMPALQQKPFVSHAFNRQCRNPTNRFPFMTTTEKKIFINVSNFQSRSKFAPNFQPNRNFRIYSDQTKNVLVSVNRGNASSDQTANHKFVGLKLTSEGNNIQFGKNGTSQIQFPDYNQQNLVPEQNNSPTPNVFVSQEASLLEDMLSQCCVPHEIENQVQAPITPLDGMSLEQQVLQPFGTSGNEKIQFPDYNQQNLVPEHNNSPTPNVFVSQEASLLENMLSQCCVPHEIENQVQAPITPLDGMSLEQHILQPFGTSGDENTEAVPAQFHNDSSMEALMNLEDETIDTPSTFVFDHELLLPWLDILNNDTPTSIEGSSENHFSRPLEFNEFIEQKEIGFRVEQENETIDTPSTFVSDQDLLLPWLDILNNNTPMSIEGSSSENHFSRPLEFNEFIEQEEIDRFLQNGTGNTSSEVDWNDLNNSLFDYDF